MDAREQLGQPRSPGALVGGVVDDLADRRDSGAAWKLRVPDRHVTELAPRRASARDRKHVFGDIDADYVVAGVEQQLRTDACATPELDDEPEVRYAPQQLARRGAREVAEALVVDAREVGGVEAQPPRSPSWARIVAASK